MAQTEQPGKDDVLLFPSLDETSNEKSKAENSFGSTSYKCSFCDDAFPSALKLEAHMRNHIWGPGEEKRESDIPADIPLETNSSETDVVQACLFCREVFSKTKSLNKHYTQFHTEVTMCLDCNMIIGLYSPAKEHMMAHISPDSLTCTICRDKFPSISYLKKHVKRVHSAKRYRCWLCRKTFMSPKFLNEHLKRHESNPSRLEQPAQVSIARVVHSEESLTRLGLSCAFCSKIFLNEDFLAKHMQTHTGIQTDQEHKVLNGKKYPCNKCYVDQGSAGKLRQHINSQCNVKVSSEEFNQKYGTKKKGSEDNNYMKYDDDTDEESEMDVNEKGHVSGNVTRPLLKIQYDYQTLPGTASSSNSLPHPDDPTVVAPRRMDTLGRNASDNYNSPPTLKRTILVDTKFIEDGSNSYFTLASEKPRLNNRDAPDIPISQDQANIPQKRRRKAVLKSRDMDEKHACVNSQEDSAKMISNEMMSRLPQPCGDKLKVEDPMESIPDGTKNRVTHQKEWTPVMSVGPKKSAEKIRYQCGVCNYSFDNLEDLTDHETIHEGNVQRSVDVEIQTCKICGASFPSKAEHEAHLSEHRHMREDITCVCGESHEDYKLYFKHMLMHNTFRCRICLTNFPDITKLLKHTSSEHVADGILTCSVCSVNLNDSQIQVHMRRHGVASWICAYCGLVLSSDEKYQEHKKVEHKIYTCDVCFCTFQHFRSIYMHKLEHFIVGDGSRTCASCQLEFIMPSVYAKHCKECTSEQK